MDYNFEKYYEEHFPVWNKLSPEQQSLLCRFSTYAEYDRGENIHGNSGRCTGAVFVISGSLRTYMLSEEGREITLYRLNAGSFCMLSASCVLKTITFDVFVDAEEKSRVLIINPEMFSRVMSENLYLENYALKVATSRFSDVMWAMQQILFMSFDRRLALFLIQELTQKGGDTVYLTQESIAKYMGSAREVVSRMLKYFSNEGLVEVSRGGVKVLDKPRLSAIAGLGYIGN